MKRHEKLSEAGYGSLFDLCHDSLVSTFSYGVRKYSELREW